MHIIVVTGVIGHVLYRHQVVFIVTRITKEILAGTKDGHYHSLMLRLDYFFHSYTLYRQTVSSSNITKKHQRGTSCMHRRWGITHHYHHDSLTFTIDYEIFWVNAEGVWELSTLAQVCLTAKTRKITNEPSATVKLSVPYKVKVSSKITESKLPADYCRVFCSPGKCTDSAQNEWCTIVEIHIHTATVWAWVQDDLAIPFSSRVDEEI